MNRLLFTSLLLFACTGAESATVVEIREQENTVSWVEISGQQVRMTGLGEPYVLVDTIVGKFVAVFPSGRQAIDISVDLPAQTPTEPRTPPHRLGIQRIGTAESIAGYPTEHYRIAADGRHCAEVWLSREALEIPGTTPYLRAFRLFYEQQRGFFESQDMHYEPCDDARQAAMNRFKELGVPLRTRDANGRTLQEIVSIETNVNLDKERFRIPDGYEILNIEDMRR